MKSKIIVNIKKLISVLICTMLIASTLPANSLNYMVSATTYMASEFGALKYAVEHANDGDTIRITSDFEIPNSARAPEENYHCVLNCSKNITIKSMAGQTYTINHRSPDGLLAITNGATVTFENIIIDCGRTNDSSNFDVANTLIKLYGGSTLNITSGTTLRNAYVKDGSFIYCADNSNVNIDQTSTLTNLHTPFDGVIYVDNNSTLTLNGTISNCSACNGGAIYTHNSTVTINGNISYCTAQSGGGAIHSDNSTATINGNISNCTATNSGGAIHSDSSTLTLNNTTISNCSANAGGSIYLSSGTTTISGNISNCSAKYGGAIYSEYEAQLQIGSGSISGCASTYYDGLGNAIYNGLGSELYLTSPNANLFTINVPTDSQGTDNAQEKYGYSGIYDEDVGSSAILLYRVQFDLNGGADSNNNTSIDPVYVTSGETLGNMLPTNITKTVSGVDLNIYRWIDSNKNVITSTTPINQDITLHARYGVPIVTAPSITKAQSGAAYTAGSWSNENITLSYSVSSPDTYIDLQKYKISLNGTDFNDISSYSSSGTIDIDSMNVNASTLQFTILKSGEYQIRIQAFDSEGLSTTSDSVSIKIDTATPESVKIKSGSYSNVDTIEMYGTGEPGCTVSATDENNNIIGTSVVDTNSEWAITTSSMQDGQHTISIVQTDSAGNTSNPTSKDIIVDTISPTGNISIGSNNFYQFLNTITFGLLFTETTNVTISASDDSSLSGVKTIEYLKTDQVYSTITNIPANANWQTDTISNNSISFDTAIPQNQLNNKFFIYAKITDNAGNETYLRSDGVILYTDSTVTTEEISHTKLDEQNKDLSVTLNGNIISSITNGTNTLTKNTDYRIENNKIILKHEYLNSLDAGDYELKIHFTPAGETNLDPNLTLPSSTVALYVEKSSQQRPPEDAKFNNLQSSYTYGDNPGIISLNGGSGTGAITYISTNPEVATINPTTGEINILKAGTFEIVATKAADDNYGQLVVTSDEIVVNRRNVTITGVTAQSKVYDGNKNAAFDITSAQINNLVNNDQVTIQPGTATFTDKNVANTKTVSFSDFALTGNDSANYTLSAQPSDTTANITSKSVTITGVTAQKKVYDGNANATPIISSASIDGKIDGDNLSFTPGTAAFSDKNVADAKTVSFSGFALTGSDSSNYTLSAQPSNTTENITRKPVTITGVTARSKIYDGNINASFDITNAQINNLINNDQVTIQPGTATFTDKNVANTKTVSFSGFALAGNDASNYYLSAQPANDTANIDPQPVIITGVTAQNKEYDGTDNAIPVTSNASINHKVAGDDLSFVSGSAHFSDKNVENEKIITFTDFVLSGNDSNNYLLYNQPTYTRANITPKPLTVSNVAIKDKIFDETTTAEYDRNPTLDGLVNGDNVTLINGTPIFTSANIGTAIPIIFSTPFLIEGNDVSNYSIIQPSGVYANIVAYNQDNNTDTDVDDDTTSNITNSEDNTSLESPELEYDAPLQFPELEDNAPLQFPELEDNAPLQFPELENNIISGPFEAGDPATGIQVSAPEGVIPPWCTLVIEEIYPNTDEYNETYEKLDSDKRNASERNKLYEIHLEDQDGNIIQPDTSKGLLTVRIPVPNDYDLNDLEIYRINEGTDDDFDENVITVNNKNYCEYQTDHFSPYAMVDKSTMYYVVQSILPYLILFLILLFISLFIIILLKRSKDREEQQ